jgi:hypothetical protein
MLKRTQQYSDLDYQIKLTTKVPPHKSQLLTSPFPISTPDIDGKFSIESLYLSPPAKADLLPSTIDYIANLANNDGYQERRLGAFYQVSGSGKTKVLVIFKQAK